MASRDGFASCDIRPLSPVMAPARMTPGRHRATLPLECAGWGAEMVTGPGDELAAAAAGRGRLRVSHADREQVIGTLKAAFVQGMLAKDEFDLRVGQAFVSRTYAELTALTADLPAGLAVAQPPRPARTQDEIMHRPGWFVAVATALCAGVQAFVFLPSWPTNSEGDPPQGLILLFFVNTLMYLFAVLIGVVNMVALRREKRSGGRPPRRPAPGAGGQASPRPPSASPGEELPPTGHGHQHTAEAERSQPPRPPGPGSRSPRRWRPSGLLAATAGNRRAMSV